MSVPDIGSHVPSARSGAKSRHHGQVEHEHFGLNTSPGTNDDGWITPPGVTLQCGSTIQLYKDGEGLLAAYRAIERAQRRICLETYIWRADATGKRFVELLCEKARSGVRVYVVYDSFGSDHPKRWMFRQMKKAGVKLGEFHPIRPWECKYSWRPMNRDHRKLCVLDNDTAWLGGLNIGDEYGGEWVAGKDADTSWLMRDTAIAVTGPAARPLQHAFAHTWSYIHHGGRIARTLYTHNLDVPRDTKGRRLGKQRRYDANGSSDVIRGELAVMASSPTLASPLRPVLYSLLRNARTSIRMIMAYFAPDDELISVLCDAAKRGCEVQVILAAKSDMNIMMVAARAFYDRLMDAGVKVYERQGAVLHAKTLTVDGEIAIVGSTNLDYRSIEFNLELSALVRNAEFARQVDRLMQHDIFFSRRIIPEQWRNRPTWDRFVQWCVNRMRYLL
jgi:cardiolipin synthase A/B